jgi:hypothetical protein
MNRKFLAVALAALFLPACGRTRYTPPPNVSLKRQTNEPEAKAALQPSAFDPVHAALDKAEKLFEQVDYEGVVETLAPHEKSPSSDRVRLRQLLGAAYYLTGNQEAAAKVFRTCPARSSLAWTEFQPSLQAFYRSCVGGE